MDEMILWIVIPQIPNVTEEKDIARLENSIRLQQTLGLQVKTLTVNGENEAQCFNRGIQMAKEGYIWFVYPWMTLKEQICHGLLSQMDGAGADLLIMSYELLSWNVAHKMCRQQVLWEDREFAGMLPGEAETPFYNVLWNKIFSLTALRKGKLQFDENKTNTYGTAFVLEYLRLCKKILQLETIGCQYIELPQKESGLAVRMSEKTNLYRLLCDYELSCNPTVDKRLLDRYYLDYIVYELSRCKKAEEKKAIYAQLKQYKEKLQGSRMASYLYVGQGRLRTGLSPKKVINFLKEQKKERADSAKEQKEKKTALLAEKKQEQDYRQKVSGAIKDILLYCESATMFSHIWDYYECVKHCENLRFFVYYADGKESFVKDEVSVIAKKEELAETFFHLVVCADAGVPFSQIHEKTKLLYINHGLHMISYDGGKSLYAYAKGRGVSEEGKPYFDGMLEPNRKYAEELVKQNPLLAGRIVHTGYKKADAILHSLDKKEEMRMKLGIRENEKLVAVFGSWGADSLFHSLGEDFLRQAEGLFSEGYRFLLSIHPKEYERYDENITPMGAMIDAMKERGFLVRNPKEDSVPYMVASDIVICDFTTLCEEAMIAGKPVILSEFSKERVWEKSTIAGYLEEGPVLHREEPLKDALEAVCGNEEVCKLTARYAADIMPNSAGYRKQVEQTTKQLLKLPF